MAFAKKTWKARLVEFAGRRALKNVATEETVIYDVTRNEGTVSQAGDAFSATNMNDLENRIESEFNNLNASGAITGYEVTEDGAYISYKNPSTGEPVKKKLGDREFAALDCGGVSWKQNEFGQWHHGYHFTKISEIPNFGSMIHRKDFFIEVYNGGTEQSNVGIGVSYVKHSNSELVMTSTNGLNSLYVRIYYAVN